MSDINEALGIDNEPKQTEPNSEGRTTSNKIILAVILYIIAIIISIFGLFTTYQTPDSMTKIVGGDAYNYIIYASRGIVLVGFGILVSIIGLAIQISGRIK